MSGPGRWLLPIAILVLGPAFWLAALVGTHLPTTLSMAITLTGPTAAGYSGHVRLSLAPLPPRVIADARRDAGLVRPTTAPTVVVTPRATTTPTATPQPAPPTSPTPTQSPSSGPLPMPTPLPAPPVPTGLPTPTALPTLPPGPGL